jgi:molybdopterin molybdotransferase
MDSVEQLLSVAEARTRLLQYFSPLATETVPLAASMRRVLGADVAAQHDLPPFANSSMDGYAVRWSEAAAASPDAAVRLPVSGDIPAGSGLPSPLAPGTAARIMTGAPVPAGADAVVPVEDTDDRRDRVGGVPAVIGIRKAPAAGQNVRPAGQDVRAGQVVLRAGTVVSPAVLGVLAALGQAEVMVHRQPRVALFSTGDELREVDEALGPGQIRDVNSHTLAAAAEAQGAQVLRLGIVRDRLEAVRETLAQAAAEGADLILSSAGVSVGAYDVVKAAVEADGGLAFWRVKMRPGKPLAFGHVHGVPFFGLPGNPVSALMTFEVFVRPALLKLAGRRQWDKLAVTAALGEPVRSDGRESYLRVVLTRQGGDYVARLAGDQGSAVLSSLVRANGLLILPEGVTAAQAGERFTVWLVDGVESALESGE